MLCWSPIALLVWWSLIGRPNRTYQSRQLYWLRYPTPKAPTFPWRQAASPRPPLNRFRFRAQLWSVTMIHTACRNTQSNSRWHGEAASFASAVAVTLMPVAASALGQRAMSYSTNYGANPSFHRTCAKNRAGRLLQPLRYASFPCGADISRRRIRSHRFLRLIPRDAALSLICQPWRSSTPTTY